jgi:ribonuclease HII
MERGPTLDRELALRGQGYHAIAGLDEVGRGSWAGPVVACAIILPLDSPTLLEELAGIRDSKRLTASRRAEFYDQILSTGAAPAVGVASAAQVDSLGIVSATKLAMSRALDRLPLPPDYLLVDGFPLAYRGLPHEGIPGGDDRCVSIAAASIVAKVVRDGMMVGLGQVYPGYDFAQHKGYGTSRHRDALHLEGPCPIHRLSYAPVRLVASNKQARLTSRSAHRTAAQVGRQGEQLAAAHLEELGWVVCEMNYRCAAGEMDIIALDGRCLAFVEVRTRRGRSHGLPVESITSAKKKRLIEVAETYLQEHSSQPLDWRIDVVSILMSGGGRVQQMELLRNAVEES